MFEMFCDVAIVGGGPAGLSAAVAAKEEGSQKVLIIERDNALGGILQQCIHPGFGLKLFNEELTGPEYYGRFIKKAKELGVEYLLSTMVLEVNAENKIITCVNSQTGLTLIKAGSIVLAMGCRERTRANIMVPGTRPAGLYTAGSAQRLLNRQNIMVGKKIVILGSGDIGMIMARRMTLEGARVVMVVELMDYLAGLTRNKVQCLDDFGIPLRLSHTITKIVGNKRVEGVYVAPVGPDRKPVVEKEEFVECDTVLFSVGLIPENELTKKAGIKIDPVTSGPAVDQYMQTSAEGIFACGNVVHVNDLVDNVSSESAIAGKYAAKYAAGNLNAHTRLVRCVPGVNIRYICPQFIKVGGDEEKARLYFRVQKPMKQVTLVAKSGSEIILKQKEIRVNPGEMNSMEIETSKLASDDLILEVDSDSQA
ncbi:MAG TPA: FAD-dependent oxidoreductase [Clostridiaceae bacterium]|nr:FAD-dependent oxidoreductase [Clostridiaceae bacterium]